MSIFLGVCTGLDLHCQFCFITTGHLCSSSVSQHGKDSLHFRSGCLHPQLRKRCVQGNQVCGVPDTTGCQRLLQLHNALPPALLEHVHWSRYMYSYDNFSL